MCYRIIQSSLMLLLLMLLLLPGVQAELKVRNLYFVDKITNQYPNKSWAILQDALDGQDILQVQGITGKDFPHQWETNIQNRGLQPNYRYAHSYTSKKSTSFFYNSSVVELLQTPYNVDLRQIGRKNGHVAVAKFRIKSMPRKPMVAFASVVRFEKEDNSFNWLNQINTDSFQTTDQFTVVMTGSVHPACGINRMRNIPNFISQAEYFPLKNNHYRINYIGAYGLDRIGKFIASGMNRSAMYYNDIMYCHHFEVTLYDHDEAQMDISDPRTHERQIFGSELPVRSVEHHVHSDQSNSPRPSTSRKYSRVRTFMTNPAILSPTGSVPLENRRSPLRRFDSHFRSPLRRFDSLVRSPLRRFDSHVRSPYHSDSVVYQQHVARAPLRHRQPAKAEPQLLEFGTGARIPVTGHPDHGGGRISDGSASTTTRDYSNSPGQLGGTSGQQSHLPFHYNTKDHLAYTTLQGYQQHQGDPSEPQKPSTKHFAPPSSIHQDQRFMERAGPGTMERSRPGSLSPGSAGAIGGQRSPPPPSPLRSPSSRPFPGGYDFSRSNTEHQLSPTSPGSRSVSPSTGRRSAQGKSQSPPPLSMQHSVPGRLYDGGYEHSRPNVKLPFDPEHEEQVYVPRYFTAAYTGDSSRSPSPRDDQMT